MILNKGVAVISGGFKNENLLHMSMEWDMPQQSQS